MGWADSVVTKTGIYLLNESLAGYALTIRHGAGGAGLVDPGELEDAAALSEPKQTFDVSGVEDVEGGKRVRIQITNQDVEETYILHQIGVFARLDYQEEDSLLFLMQDSRGVQIPSREENPEFLLEIYAILAIDNAADIQVNIDASTVVSEGFLQETLQSHNGDGSAHPELRAQLEQAQETAEAAAQSAQSASRLWGPVAVTIPLSWSGSGPWTQTVAVEGVTAEMEHLTLSLAKGATAEQEKALSCVTWCETVSGGILLTCRDQTPAAAISCVLKGVV